MPFGTAVLPVSPPSYVWKSQYAGVLNDVGMGLFLKPLKLEYMVTPLRSVAPELISSFRRLVEEPAFAVDVTGPRTKLCLSTLKFIGLVPSQLTEGGSMVFKEVRAQVKRGVDTTIYK